MQNFLDKELVDRFRDLETKLHARCPNAQREAQELSQGVTDPKVADANAVWGRIWDKPLYANTKVAIANAAILRLKPFVVGAWKQWGSESGDFLIAKIGKGSSTVAFEAVTPLAKSVREVTGIAMHRLFAFQGAAGALRAREAKSDTPYSDLPESDIKSIIPSVQQEMGPGWGHVTVLHFLTDIGIACKPDMHLVNTVRHLGMSIDLDDRKVPSLSDAVTINLRVRALAEMLYGSSNPTSLRYLDKTLMDISMHGILTEHLN